MFSHLAIYVFYFVQHLFIYRAIYRVVRDNSSSMIWFVICTCGSNYVSSSCHLSLLNDLKKEKGLKLLTYRFWLRTMDFNWGYLHVKWCSIIDRVHGYVLIASLLRIGPTQWQHYHLSLYVAVSKWSLRWWYLLFFVIDGRIYNLLLQSPWKNGRGWCRIFQQGLPALLLVVDSVCEVTD